MLFSQRLRGIRKAKDLSQKEFADLLGINPVTLSHYENEKREPDLDRLATLCQKLSVSADYLIGLTDNIGSPLFAYTEKLSTDVALKMEQPRSALDDLHGEYLKSALDYIEFQRQKQAADFAESKSEAR